MLKRILSIFRRDLSSSFRDYLLLYMLVAPLLLAIGFKFFIPSAQSAALQFAIDENLEVEVIEEFEKYGNVEIYSSSTQMIDRINDMDDIAGVSMDSNGQYQIILEGNESHDTKAIPSMIIRNLMNKRTFPVDYTISDIGFKMPPVAWIGSVSLLLMAVLIGGVMVGFNIIEEKETGTFKALRVTPMTRFEFILGRSIIGIVIPILQVYGILWILGMLPDVHPWMLLTMTLASSSIGILIGFLFGGMSSNQIVGIANMKMIFMIVSITMIGTILLPADKHYFLYWAPTYWSFTGFKGILLDTIDWTELGLYILWTFLSTSIFLTFFKRKITRGLS
ncbi:ABC transporter permease [Clostridiaceae bacterium 35-E11]